MVERKRKRKIYEINNFYRSYENHFLIFSSVEAADACPINEFYRDYRAQLNTLGWSLQLKSPVFDYKLGEPIFLFEKDFGGNNVEKYWHIITNDKIGWIVVRSDTKLEKIER